MRVYGLTGGIGSGKSEVARRFAGRGIPLLDADSIGHEVIGPSGAAREAVIEAFGADVVTGGEIDRQKLGARVFADGDERERLNAIVHPRIRAALEDRMRRLEREGFPVAVIEAALFAEGKALEPRLDGLIVVTCPEEMRVRRLVERRGFSPDEARRRMAAQGNPEAKVALATHVIQNEGTLEELRQRADVVADDLMRPRP